MTAAVGVLSALSVVVSGGVAQAQVVRPIPGPTPPLSVETAPVRPVPVEADPVPDTAGPDAPPRESQPGSSEPTSPTGARPKSSLVGYDVSWPQCGEALPTDPAFAIIGVTGGLANNTNPCLAEQLAWAETTVGGTPQPPVALYVNTANPGIQGSWWPTSDTYSGLPIDNPYGTCAGGEDAACAYVYGWAKAHDATTIRGVESPGAYLWWLDVEWENSWSDDRVANRAVLEAMTARFQEVGGSVGLYSTGRQWGSIVGSVPPDSSLYNLPSWLAGAHTLSGAKDNCSLPPLTGGGTVTLTQYLTKNLDHNHSCI
jgi:hypothetical protein